jgi:hypothetical protein
MFQEVSESSGLLRAEMLRDIAKMMQTLKAFEIGGVSVGGVKAEPVQVQLFVKTADETITLDMDASDTVALLKARIYDKQKRLVHLSQPLKNMSTLSESNLLNNASLVEVGRLDGGGLVKKHMKREDAVKDLKVRVMSAIQKSGQKADKDTFETVVEEDLGDHVKGFLSEMTQSITVIKMMKANNEDVIGAGLQSISDDDLVLLADVLENKKHGHRYSSEAKLQKAMPILFKCFRQLDNARQAIINTHQSLEKEAVNLLLDEFHSYQNGSATCDMTGMKVLVDKEVMRRELMPNAPRANRCVIS